MINKTRNSTNFLKEQLKDAVNGRRVINAKILALISDV